MDKQQSIAALQAYVTGLAAQGFTKLGEKYAEHAAEEMGWVAQFIERILDLGEKIGLQNWLVKQR